MRACGTRMATIVRPRRPRAVLSAARGPACGPPAWPTSRRVAGVSHQTVSRVLNDFPSIRPGTRQRVLEAISLLGYRRNTAARTLATNRSGSIGVITADMSHFGPASTMLGHRGGLAGGGVQPHPRRPGGDHPRLAGRGGRAGARAGGGGPRGDRGPPGGPAAQRSRSHIDIPVVVVEGDLSAPAPDRRGRQRRRAPAWPPAHLLDLGHETVAHLAGPRAGRGARPARGLALRAAGQGPPGARRCVGAATGPRAAATRSPAGRWRATDSPPCSWPTTRWPWACCVRWRVGPRVPEDVSVVGFDDLPEAAYFTPPLTTVRQDFVELGSRAIGLILARARRRAGGLGAPGASRRWWCGPPPPLPRTDRRTTGPDRRTPHRTHGAARIRTAVRSGS